MSKFATKIVKFLTAFVLLQSALFAQENAKMQVERITPSLKNDFLAVSASFSNLFSQKIIGTIQSGLPSIIQVDIAIQNSNQKVIAQKRVVRRIIYNVWEEKYTIDFGDSAFVSTNLDTIKKIGSNLKNLPAMEINQLPPDEKHFIQMRVGIIPISSKQAEKVSDWLLAPNQTEEYIAAEDRSSGFELNLNKLVSFFVSSQNKSSYASDWSTSKAFTINELKQ